MLKILDPMHLVRLKPTKLFALSVIRDLSHADMENCISSRATLRCQNIHLAQLRNDLFRLVSITHFLSSSGKYPYFGSGHPIGGGSPNQKIGLCVQQAIKRLLHGATNNAIEMAVDALLVDLNNVRNRLIRIQFLAMNRHGGVPLT